MSTTANGRRPHPRLLLWSAPDQAGDLARREELGRWLALRERDTLEGAEAAGWTQDREAWLVRGAIVAATASEAARKLRAARRPRAVTDPPRPVALLFPGQGAQSPRMADGLYGQQPTFTAEMDRVFAGLGELGQDVRSDWLADRPLVPLDDVSRAQPLLFAINHALGRMLLAAGVLPVALLGHSVGEFVAATLAGVFAVEDASALLVNRIIHIGRTPPGGMLAVAASPEQLRPLLRDGVVIGAINGYGQTMLAGPEQPLAELAAQLREQNVVCRLAKARQAFHSPLIAPACAASEPLIGTVPLRTPRIPLHSAYTAAPITAEQAVDPAFWLMQPAEPVLFAPALDNLLTRDLLLVEVGPGQGLTALARRHPAVVSGRSAVTPLLPAGPSDATTQRRSVLQAMARIWTEGHSLDLTGVDFGKTTLAVS